MIFRVLFQFAAKSDKIVYIIPDICSMLKVAFPRVSYSLIVVTAIGGQDRSLEQLSDRLYSGRVIEELNNPPPFM